MSGNELRGWAWSSVKGQRADILLAFAVSGLPILAASALRQFGVEALFHVPLSLAGGVFHFGFYRYVLRRVENGQARLKDLGFAWGRAFLWTALAAVLLQALCSMALELGPNWLQEQGDALRRQAMAEDGQLSDILGLPFMRVADQALYDRGTTLSWAGILLQMAAGKAVQLLFLPLSASLAVGKTGRAREVVPDSLRLGARRFGRSLVFLFWVELPLFAGLAVVAALGLLAAAAALPFTLVYLVFRFWYLPYESAAEVLYARELFFPRGGGPVKEAPPPPRTMRLRRGGGGWHWHRMGGEAGEQDYLEKKGLRP